MCRTAGCCRGCSRALAALVLLCVGGALSLPTPAEGATTSVGADSTTMAAMTTPSAGDVPASQDLSKFFPSIKNDLTKVTWAHAVNSQELLEKALNDTSILMLEADIVLGKTSSQDNIPIMGHPPETSSDLSLQDFLHRVVTYNHEHSGANATRRGVKLDFKSIEVYRKSMDVLKQTFKEVPDFPVWLNADILSGPVNSTTTPVDSKSFLTLAKTEYPSLTLSLGYTTAWGNGVTNQSAVPADQVKYSPNNVDEMVSAVKGISQPITYAVRAAFVAHSLDELKSLLSQTSGKPTLTVWSSDATDVIDVAKLRDNILAIGKDRVYLDVGADLEKKLDLASSAMSVYASVATTIVALLAVMLRGL